MEPAGILGRLEQTGAAAVLAEVLAHSGFLGKEAQALMEQLAQALQAQPRQVVLCILGEVGVEHNPVVGLAAQGAAGAGGPLGLLQALSTYPLTSALQLHPARTSRRTILSVAELVEAAAVLAAETAQTLVVAAEEEAGAAACV